MNSFSTYAIELLEANDAPALAALEARCFSTPWTEEQYRKILKHKPEKGRGLSAAPVFGVRDAEGHLAAYLCLGVNYAAEELEIYNIAVESAHRRLGIGRRLLHSALKCAAEQGIRTAFLEVREHNLPALGLYESLGFTACGRRKNYYADTGEAALVMQADLNIFL